MSNLRKGVNCVAGVVALEDDVAAEAMSKAKRDKNPQHQERFFSAATLPTGAPNTVLLFLAPLAPRRPDAVGIISGFRRPQLAHRQAVHYGRWNTRVGLTDAVDTTADMLPVTLLQQKQVSAASGAWRKSRVVEWAATCTETDCE